MYIVGDSLDDLLRKVFNKLLKSNNRPNPTKGNNRELTATLLKIKNPRARLSRTERRGTLVSCLGETLWYLSGSDKLDFIEYYISNYRYFSKIPPDATIAEGAYGPRIFGEGTKPSQIHRVISLLKEQDRHDTRQAVIQIFDKSDWGRKDVPCTCNLQFLARGNSLHMFTTMRSNDAYRGLPHDVFAFTMLQELVARSIGHDVGIYSHAVGSLHLYEKDETAAKQYLTEGWQDVVEMPAMPTGDPWKSVNWLLNAENVIRCGNHSLPSHTGIEPYWLDLARILLVNALWRANELRGLIEVKQQMSSPIYDAFIRKREKALAKKQENQLSFPT